MVFVSMENRQLATELENGDKIDIITNATARPLAEWRVLLKLGGQSALGALCG